MLTPDENVDRLRRGLAALISGRAIDLGEGNSSFIAIFDGHANRFSGGRILLFQQFFFDRFGTIPEIIKQVPACIKVFFRLDNELVIKADLHKLVESDEFNLLCRDLRIKQVQIGQKLHYFNIRD